MRIRLEQIKEAAKIRSDGYEQDVLGQGKVDGDFLVITPEAYSLLRAKYAPKSPEIKRGCCGKAVSVATPAQRMFPPLSEQAKNLTRAVARVAGELVQGRPVAADKETIANREAICDKCEHYSHGRCKLCGCYLRIKRTLSTEHCPATPPKW